MKRNGEVLAIIPAKGKSIGIPKKNMVILHGKPLIYWTILAAKQSKLISRIIISSENQDILDYGLDSGIDYIKRPKHLATDFATSEDVIINVLSHLKNIKDYQPEAFVLLQPTSPLRDHNDIDKALELFFFKKCSALISGYEPDTNPLKQFIVKKNGYITSLRNEEDPFLSRQKLPEAFKPNGALFIIRTKEFLKNGKLLTKSTLPFYMDKDKSVDIDNLSDLNLAAAYLSNKSGDK